ncbi:NADH oxidase [Alphaproteobacteria bacterium SO-S41]|nr:NADH oxidase [Alphaproteobacteria bacterium SO-S41]
MTASIEPLFQSFQLRGLTLRNHFTMSPMQKFRPADHVPHDEMVEYHRIRARNGIAMIVSQGTAIGVPGATSAYAWLQPSSYDAWARIADAVRSEGCHMSLQVYYDAPSRDKGAFGPSGYTTNGEKKRDRGMAKDEIDFILETYAEAAAAVKRLGFTGIELHGGQGGLFGQFMSPLANFRDDEYGGATPQERLTLPMKLVRTVREAAGPDLIVGLRQAQVWEAKLFDTPEEYKIFLDGMIAAGVDVFNCGVDLYWRPEYAGSHMNLGGWIKKLTGHPVITSGAFGLDNRLADVVEGTPANNTVRQGFGDLMNRFHNGEFDMFALGRTILCDPDYLLKLRDGRFDEMMPTIDLSDVAGNQITFTKGKFAPQTKASAPSTARASA